MFSKESPKDILNAFYGMESLSSNEREKIVSKVRKFKLLSEEEIENEIKRITMEEIKKMDDELIQKFYHMDNLEYYEKINIIEEIEERNLLPEKEIEIYMDKIEEQNINENIEEEASKWTKENWLENFERINYVYKSVADIITEKLINENWKNEEEIKQKKECAEKETAEYQLKIENMSDEEFYKEINRSGYYREYFNKIIDKEEDRRYKIEDSELKVVNNEQENILENSDNKIVQQSKTKTIEYWIIVGLVIFYLINKWITN